MGADAAGLAREPNLSTREYTTLSEDDAKRTHFSYRSSFPPVETRV